MVEIGQVFLEKILKYRRCLPLRYNLPLKKDVTFHLYKLVFPSAMNALCQVKLKWGAIMSSEEDENVKTCNNDNNANYMYNTDRQRTHIHSDELNMKSF